MKYLLALLILCSCSTEQKFWKEVNTAKKYMRKGFDAKTTEEANKYFNKANHHLSKADSLNKIL